MLDLETYKDKLKISKIFLQTMLLHKTKSSYLDEKLVQISKNLKELFTENFEVSWFKC